MTWVLALNAGSATLKFRLYEFDGAGAETNVAEGLADAVSAGVATLTLRRPDRPPVQRRVPMQGHGDAVRAVLSILTDPAGGVLPSLDVLAAVGHRVVHGGSQFTGPTRVTPEVARTIGTLRALAPLHNQVALDGIEAVTAALPAVPQVAVFDTAFHQTLPPVAAQYALPVALRERHPIRRFGFHGLSHQYVSARLLVRLGQGVAGTRVVTCHLGSGASVAAIRDGLSVDTSMGMTPLEGLVMGTRCGDLDPGVLLYLGQVAGFTMDELDDLLNYQSGLRGLSGRSGDVRELEAAAAQSDAQAELALAIFAYRVRKYVGAYAAALGGIDALAFTGGIGEHGVAMRPRICAGLEFLGVELDPARNAAAAGDTRISSDAAHVQVWVIPTNEELVVARDAWRLAVAPR